ncbi:NAD-dependent epimerase/dehydratase family protein [Nioella aestuarii]|uniref:NAD-dependent epimerase/dehydratase family protein n=1 Tax=Nioella aestuarii TaxID=1662864 RepID=UPI003D7F7C90
MGALKLCITGAGSYVGRAAADYAMRAGHQVVLHSRYGHRNGGSNGPDVTYVEGALHSPDLAGMLAGSSAVIHVAGRMAGTDAEFQQDVVEDSAALMRAAAEAGVSRVVLAGSVSVYGAGEPGGVITEDSPLEPRPDLRDAYTRAKLMQEECMQAEAARAGIDLSILRLGAIWGPGRLWSAHFGPAKGAVLIRIGRDGQVPLCEIDRAGEALISAVTAPSCTVNVLDDDLPDRVRFLNALSVSGWPRVILPVHWRFLDCLAGDNPNRPGLLRRPVLRARMMPMGWDGHRAVAALGLAPQHEFEALMAANLIEGANA